MSFFQCFRYMLKRVGNAKVSSKQILSPHLLPTAEPQRKRYCRWSTRYAANSEALALLDSTELRDGKMGFHFLPCIFAWQIMADDIGYARFQRCCRLATADKMPPREKRTSSARTAAQN